MDHEKDRVVVDSLRICEHLIDNANSTKRLLGDTESERADILQQASVVDRTPQPALLYGFHPDDDRRPEFIKAKMADAYDLKIEALTLLRDQNLHDTELASAYTAKISKEAQGKRFAHDAKQQREVRATTRNILEQLSQRLERSQNLWVCGDTSPLRTFFGELICSDSSGWGSRTFGRTQLLFRTMPLAASKGIHFGPASLTIHLQCHSHPISTWIHLRIYKYVLRGVCPKNHRESAQ